MPRYYPVMLDVRERAVVVVGGDAIAAQKAATLAASGARVSALSLAYSEEMRELAERGQVVLRWKRYEPGDLAGASLVVAATDDEQLIEAIWRETQQHGQLVNIVDRPQYCSFILPSVLRRGKLTVAVSTEGTSPSLAKRIRQQLEEVLPAAYEAYLDLATVVRAHLRGAGISYNVRDDFFRAFMASPVLSFLDTGEVAQALQTTSALLHAYGLAVPPSELEQEFVKEQQEYAASKL